MNSLQKKIVKTIVSESEPIASHYCLHGKYCVLGILAAKAEVSDEKLQQTGNFLIEDVKWLENRLSETYGLTKGDLKRMQEINDEVEDLLDDLDGVSERRQKLLKFIENLNVS